MQNETVLECPYESFGLVSVFEYKGEFYKAVEGFKSEGEGEMFFVQLNKAGTHEDSVLRVIADPETDGAKVPGVVADGELYNPLFAEFERIENDTDFVYDPTCFSGLGTLDYEGVTYDVLTLAMDDSLEFVDGVPQVDHGFYGALSEVSNWFGIDFEFHYASAEEAEEADEAEIEDELYDKLFDLFKEKHGVNCVY